MRLIIHYLKYLWFCFCRLSFTLIFTLALLLPGMCSLTVTHLWLPFFEIQNHGMFLQRRVTFASGHQHLTLYFEGFSLLLFFWQPRDESGLQTLRAGASAAVLFSRSPSGVGKRLVPFWLRLTVRVQAFGVPAPWEMVSYETSHLNELSSLLYDAGFTRNSLGIPLTSLCVPSFTWIFFFFF